ncbi:IS3 family transposase [Lysinibacillus sp. CD3-6]|uniref:IS3 family transposase n=1 Tax=Lysinibacillus sp. CD3-6 TaxID=2892541 RepID=UPI001173C2A7|nr:IS3 family transposase [Lysinibacillus sp. CD3-6]UED82059.1 IS3 family transposase [Lysinibacillus sp. CD3-6]
MAVQALHHNDNLSISLLCEFAGIARSAYYKWTQRTPTTRQQENDEILKEIRELHEKGQANYGYRKIQQHMNQKFNKQFNHKRILRLMKQVSFQLISSENQMKAAMKRSKENILDDE